MIFFTLVLNDDMMMLCIVRRLDFTNESLSCQKLVPQTGDQKCTYVAEYAVLELKAPAGRRFGASKSSCTVDHHFHSMDTFSLTSLPDSAVSLKEMTQCTMFHDPDMIKEKPDLCLDIFWMSFVRQIHVGYTLAS